MNEMLQIRIEKKGEDYWKIIDVLEVEENDPRFMDLKIYGTFEIIRQFDLRQKLITYFGQLLRAVNRQEVDHPSLGWKNASLFAWKSSHWFVLNRSEIGVLIITLFSI